MSKNMNRPTHTKPVRLTAPLPPPPPPGWPPAAGASTRGQALSKRDQWLCQQVGAELRARGLLFVGIDVIGDYITEINVTSPTCIRELDREFEINISADLFECIEQRLSV